MRKLYVTLLVYMLQLGILCAQTYTSKDFNNIKRSKEYFYYDITMDNEQKAREAANVNLAKLINDYCVENAITNVKVGANELKDVEYMKMDKNGLVRILAYVKREAYVGKDKIVANTKPEPKQAVVAIVNIQPSVKAPSAETAALAKNEAASSLAKWQQEVLQNLCSITSAEKLIMKLSELQVQYKVKRFGLKNDCRNEEQCFWVVYDSNKNVVAILGPGTTARFNFLKGVNDKLENYTEQGIDAIWFQLSK